MGSKKLIESQDRARIITTLSERHRSDLGRDESFTVAARQHDDAVIARITLEKRDRTFVYEMEAAFRTEDERLMSKAEALNVCLDFLDWYLGEFFASGRELLLPLDWKPHRFGDVEVLARGEDRNEAIDELADAWLRGEQPEIPSFLGRSRDTQRREKRKD